MAEVRKKKRRRKLRINKTAALLIAGLVSFAVLVIVGLNVMFHFTISKYDPDIIIPGVKIGGTDVSGMNAAQAEAAVKKAVQDYASQEITLRLDAERDVEVLLADLGVYAADLDRAVRDALDYGKKGSPITCYKILKRAEKNENEKNFPVTYEISVESAGTAL